MACSLKVIRAPKIRYSISQKVGNGAGSSDTKKASLSNGISGGHGRLASPTAGNEHWTNQPTYLPRTSDSTAWFCNPIMTVLAATILATAGGLEEERVGPCSAGGVLDGISDNDAAAVVARSLPRRRALIGGGGGISNRSIGINEDSRDTGAGEASSSSSSIEEEASRIERIIQAERTSWRAPKASWRPRAAKRRRKTLSRSSRTWPRSWER
jgi:hypothetical protein